MPDPISPVPSLARLLVLLGDLAGLQLRNRKRTQQWFAAARAEVRWLLGADHPLAREFCRISWQPVGLFLPGALIRPSTARAAFENAHSKARSVLAAVVVEVLPHVGATDLGLSRSSRRSAAASPRSTGRGAAR